MIVLINYGMLRYEHCFSTVGKSEKWVGQVRGMTILYYFCTIVPEINELQLKSGWREKKKKKKKKKNE